jgi:hypothetical protein
MIKNNENELLSASRAYWSFYRSNRESIQNNQNCQISQFFRQQILHTTAFQKISLVDKRVPEKRNQVIFQNVSPTGVFSTRAPTPLLSRLLRRIHCLTGNLYVCFSKKLKRSRSCPPESPLPRESRRLLAPESSLPRLLLHHRCLVASSPSIPGRRHRAAVTSSPGLCHAPRMQSQPSVLQI